MTDISIYSDAFEKLRADFNKMMVETITNMMKKGSETATLTVKLDVEIEKTFETVMAKDGTARSRDVYIPHFAHKVTSAMQIKSQVAGAFEDECELVKEPGTGNFMLVPIGQMTLADAIDEEEDEA